MTIEVLPADSTYQVVKFIGELDKAGLSEVRSDFDTLLKDFALKYLLFDFSKLAFINSEGIGYLIEINSRLSERGASLVVVGPNAHVSDVFEAVGLGQALKISKSLNDFLNS